MQHLTCDVTGADLAESEASTLRVSGPLKCYLNGRGQVHLSKPVAAALARWLGEPVHRDGLETIEGPGPAEAEAGQPRNQ